MTKLYLSSYLLGNKTQDLLKLAPEGSKVAIIANALDGAEKQIRDTIFEREVGNMKSLKYLPEEIDLRDFFIDNMKLEERLSSFDMLWVTGGNVFTLALAMQISGFKNIIHSLLKNNTLVYAGYSAGTCLMGKSLKGLDLVDSINGIPKNYPKQEVIWEGLGYIDAVIVPHYKSNHHESAAIDIVVKYLEQHFIKFKTLQDGDAIVINS